jgi:serine/threonine protein kinase
VYSVVDPDTNEKYAIKKISAQEAGVLMREIDILLDGKLQHINIVRYFHFYIDGSFAYIVMELCEEGTLENYLKKFKNSIPEEVFFIPLN